MMSSVVLLRYALRSFRTSAATALWRINSTQNLCNVRSFSTRSGTGIFGLEQLHRASDWQSIALGTIQKCEQIATEIRSSNPSSHTLQLFDDLSNELCRVLDVMELCRHIHPDPEFIGEAEKWFAVLNSYMQELNADYLLYRPLSELESKSSHLALDREENMMLKSLISDMQRSGIHMPAKTRQKIVELQNKIASLGFEFTRQISRAPTPFSISKEQSKELFSPSMLASFEYVEKRHGKDVYRSDMQTLKHILHHHPKGEARKLAYLSIYSADASSIQVVESLLGARNQLARMLGYVSYSHFASLDKLVRNPERVREFLLQLNKSLGPKLESELRLLKEEKERTERSSGPIESWEVTFYCNQIRRKLNVESLRLDEYLELEACLQGMFYIANCLFDIRAVEDVTNPEKWHQDVRKFVFFNGSGQSIGTLFLDLYQRPYKYPNSTHFTIQSHRLLKDGSHQLPVIAITMNMEKNSSSKRNSTFLHPFELQTLFHEFGHALHSILSTTRFQNLAGTRTALDFVEMPSHLFEYFARDQRVLQHISKGFGNKTIPQSLVEDMLRNSQLFSGIDAQTQIFYSLLDLELHSSPNVGNGGSVEILKTVQNEYTPFRYVEGTAWHTRFGHLYGYASCYYSYLVAKVLASKIWQRLFSDNPLSKESGRLLREKVLMVGGSQSPEEILESILGNDMKADRFLIELGIDSITKWIQSLYSWLENRRNSVREMRRLRQRLRDPRFRRLPKRLQKLPTDKRFKKLSKKLLEESQPDVDKFGRPLNRNRVLSEQQELQEYYQVLSDASSSEEEEEVVPQVMETQATTSENTKEKLVVTEEASKEETGPVSSDSVPLGNETCRLAVTNMDWETLSASDILVILNSFCPESGQILSVSIHTTEYGKQWLSKESKEGPQLERFRDKALEVLNVDSQTDSLNLQQEEFDKRLSSEVARQYVLDKMKYYVGVVVCDSVATATSIYEQCDGLELESTGNVLDLRFIPDHIVFDDPPRDVAKQVPNSYEPKPFQSLPLQHTNGKLAWDEDDPHRAKLKKRRFTEQDLLDDDLRTYLASSDSEEEEDQEEKTQVYRQLASEVLQSGQNVKEEENLEMEATFISGLDNLGKKILVSKEQKELEAKESAWERRLRKMKKARKREKISEPSSVNDNSKQDAELDLLFMNEEKGYSSDEKREKPKTDDNFSLDTEDPRFAALYRSHDFALDPTDPRFKRTRGMKKLLHERSKRLYD